MDNCVEIACVRQREDHVTAIEFVDGTVLTLSALLLSALKKLYTTGHSASDSMN
jgi:hypothetical protein